MDVHVFSRIIWTPASCCCSRTETKGRRRSVTRLNGTKNDAVFDHLDDPHCRPIQSAPMKIAYPSKMSDTSSPLSTCLSPSSSLAAQFHQAVAFSPTSSFDDFHSRSSRSALPAQSASVTTTTVPLVSHSPTTNLILSLTSTPNRFEIFHQQQQRRDQSTIIDTSTAASSTNAKSAHVLCR